jgi:hypothetical protein
MYNQCREEESKSVKFKIHQRKISLTQGYYQINDSDYNKPFVLILKHLTSLN